MTFTLQASRRRLFLSPKDQLVAVFGELPVNDSRYFRAGQGDFATGSLPAVAASPPFTFGGFINIQSFPVGTTPFIFGFYDSSQASWYIALRHEEDGSLRLTIDNPDTTQINTTFAMQTGVWYHVAARVAADKIDIHVNGSTTSTQFGTATLDTSLENLDRVFAGSRGSSVNEQPFDGYLSNWALFDRFISESDLFQWADGDDPRDVTGGGPFAHWKDWWYDERTDIVPDLNGGHSLRVTGTVRADSIPDSSAPTGGLAGAEPAAPTPQPPPAGSWEPDDILPLPPGITWKELYRSDRGDISQAVIDANLTYNKEGEEPFRRLSMATRDGKAVVRHTVNIGDVVQPVGWDFPANGTAYRSLDPILFKNSLANFLLLRWHFYPTAHQGVAGGGKYMHFGGGRGWIFQSYGQNDTGTYGTDGWGFNSMHPFKYDAAKQSYMGMLSSHVGQPSLAGAVANAGASNGVPPTLNAWNVVDQLVRVGNGSANSGGYELYLNGNLVAEVKNRRPAQVSMANCLALWVRVRLMHGGKPRDERYLPVRNYTGDYGGFSIHWG